MAGPRQMCSSPSATIAFLTGPVLCDILTDKKQRWIHRDKADARARRRERAALRRDELDREYVEHFAARVRELYPHCPPGRETAIAEHACLKYSGRVGRSAAAKEFDEDAIRLAVIAHIWHAETQYDRLLAAGRERWEARAQIEGEVFGVLHRWAGQQ